jgi:hypothetical protein
VELRRAASVLQQNGGAALFSACHAGHLKVAKWLVSEGLSDARHERDAVRLCRGVACCCIDGAAITVARQRCAMHGRKEPRRYLHRAVVATWTSYNGSLWSWASM